MADEPINHMAESGVTITSDSEQYSGGEDLSTSPPSSSSPPIVLYQPPTVWSLIRGAAINLFLPFINGMMLGFGELFAHEAAFRLGWSGTRVCHPWRSASASRPHNNSKVMTNDSLDLPSLSTEGTPNWTRHRGPRPTEAAPRSGRPHEPRVKESKDAIRNIKKQTVAVY